MKHNSPLILASQSPRRAQLLREAGVDFEQRSPPFADPDQPPEHLVEHEAEDYASQLAEDKAHSLASVLTQQPVLILAADTICVDADGRLVGKPRDAEHAEAMVRSFLQREHRVLTGVSLLHIGEAGEQHTVGFADTAVVQFGAIDDAALHAYIATGDWQGKAGGYNLFDRQAAGWPISVKGDPATVVGLPMRRLMPMLTPLIHSHR